MGRMAVIMFVCLSLHLLSCDIVDDEEKMRKCLDQCYEDFFYSF